MATQKTFKAFKPQQMLDQCCVCGRTLSDAVSIEAGIGPHCSKAYYKNVPAASDATMVHVFNMIDDIRDQNLARALNEAMSTGEASRKVANVLIRALAWKQDSSDGPELAQLLWQMGYIKLAERYMKKHFLKIFITRGDEGFLNVKTKYGFGDGFWTYSVKNVGVWDSENKRHSIPTTNKRKLWEAFANFFEQGTWGIGPKGFFQV